MLRTDIWLLVLVLANARNSGRGYRDPVSVAVTRFLFGPPPEMPPARIPLNESEKVVWNTRWSVLDGDSVAARTEGDIVWLRAEGQAGMSALAGSDWP